MARTPESNEAPKQQKREVSIQTDKLYTRGIVEKGNDESVTLLITYPPKNVGSRVEIKRQSLQINAPFEYRGSNDKETTEWKQSGPLTAIAKWDCGEPISLDTLVSETENRTRSQGMPQNPLTLPQGVPTTSDIARRANAAYTAHLAPYFHHDEPKKYALSSPDDAKVEEPFRPDTGWKAHLNVTPENAQAVSEYLKNNNYNHKFLSGGEPDDGKVFTIYFGSKGVMDKWVNVLATDLHDRLAAPAAHDEVEVARGIVARFTVDDTEPRGGDEFRQYGAYGLSFLKDSKMPWKATRDEKIADATRTYERLKELYGSFFSD
ncbi:MAG: hypothetical protein WA021_00555 [Minisyncoccia bacterium]